MRESPLNIAIMLGITIPHPEAVGKMLLEDTAQEEIGFLALPKVHPGLAL